MVKLITFSLTRKLLVILVSSLLFSLAVVDFSYGQKKKKKTVPQKWSVQFAIQSTYDNNILKYSTKYLDRFMNHEDEGRFHINRYDDLVIGYSADVSYSDVFIGGVKSIISGGIKYNAYSNNSIKSWISYDIGIRQYIKGSTSFRLSYSFIPSFYVRHFRDDDWTGYYGYTPETFQPYEFSKDGYDFWIQHNLFKDTRVRLYFSYAKYFLDGNNTEYDSDDFLYGIKVYRKVTSFFSIDAAYKFITSDAKAYDEHGETKETSDDVDATFEEHRFEVSMGMKLPKIFNCNNSVSISGQHMRRIYQTTHSYIFDPIHAGRIDYNYSVDVDYKIDINNNISVTAFFDWINRDSQASSFNNEVLSEEKDYNQYQTGLKFSYNLEF
jgi:hypothetical protein